jgi:hypothetical protein
MIATHTDPHGRAGIPGEKDSGAKGRPQRVGDDLGRSRLPPGTTQVQGNVYVGIHQAGQDVPAREGLRTRSRLTGETAVADDQLSFAAIVQADGTHDPAG